MRTLAHQTVSVTDIAGGIRLNDRSAYLAFNARRLNEVGRATCGNRDGRNVSSGCNKFSTLTLSSIAGKWIAMPSPNNSCVLKTERGSAANPRD